MLETRHVSTWLHHVVTVLARNCTDATVSGLESIFFMQVLNFLAKSSSLLAVKWLSGICHYVQQLDMSHQEWKLEEHAKGLPIRGDTSFKFPSSNSNQVSLISVGCPVITFLIRSLCPGASVTVLAGLHVHREISMAILCWCSAFSLFKTQASSSETFCPSGICFHPHWKKCPQILVAIFSQTQEGVQLVKQGRLLSPFLGFPCAPSV